MVDKMRQDDSRDDLNTASSPQETAASLISAVPLLVGRSIRQVELATSLLVALTCHVTARSNHEVTADALLAAGPVQPEPFDVLDVLKVDSSDPSSVGVVPALKASSPRMEHASASPAGEQILEADLGVPGYDSLAASQVVPRLAMLATADLQAILAYEQAHRRRQTIMNRVSELLDFKVTDSE